MNPTPKTGEQVDDRQTLEVERYKLARRIHRALAKPMTVLGLVWLVLLVLDLTRGLSPFLRTVNW
ncbi:MAG TPA: hypothetical protein VJ867_16010 [Gemmatimonadaceae bacterium]|nr:hypothetical protein [Gemmatimonadaceae bacterium]